MESSAAMSKPSRVPHAHPLSSLTTQLIALVLGSTLATALVVSAVAIHASRQQLSDELAERNRFELERAGLSVGRWLAARQVEFNAALNSLSSDLAPEAMRLELEALPFVARVSRVQISQRSTSGAAGAQQAKTRIVAATEQMATPGVIGERGRNVWRASLTSRALAEALARTAPAAPHRLYLVDENGRVLARGGAGHESLNQPLTAHFPKSLLEHRGSAMTYNQTHGERIVGAARPLVGAAALLVLETPQDFAFAPARELFARILLVDLLVMAALGFLAHGIANRTFRPLHAIAEGARMISEGHMEVEIEERGSHDEIGLLTRSFNIMVQRLRTNQFEIESTNKELRSRNDELQTANEVLAQLSITDGLTHLHNHRYFQDQLTREIKIHDRNDLPLSMLLVDLDNFKQLNDQYGHAVGDEILKQVAATLNDSVRASDLLARYGGEEFVVLATNTQLDGALALGEKIRFAVDERTFCADWPQGVVPDISVSLGAAQYQGDRREFFDAADRALYRAKADGKNCVVSAEDD